MLGRTSLLFLVLPAALTTMAGCASDVVATPCASTADCPPTRTCADGHCRFVVVDAWAPDASDGGRDAGDAATNDGGPIGVDGGMDAGRDAGMDGGRDAGLDGGSDAADDAGTDGGTDVGTDAANDAGTDATNDGGHDAAIDGGCALGPCCVTTATDPCGTGFVCRPPPTGEDVGSCVACDATTGVVCGTWGGGVVETFFSECDAFAAGADVAGRGACHCGVGGVTCGGGQICDRGVRHLRDCATAAPEGICVTPSPGSCDPTPRREVTCDDATSFDDECARLGTTGAGVMTRFAIACASVPPVMDGCYDDRDCTHPASSCYGAHDCATGGTCQADPAPGDCIDQTDCAPWQACTAGHCVDVR